MDCDFSFVSTKEIGSTRLSLGYSKMDDLYPFVLKAYESKEIFATCISEIKKADIILVDGVYKGKLYKAIKPKKQIVYRMAERFQKDQNNKIKKFLRYVKYYYVALKDKGFRLLCMGHFSSIDFSYRTYKNKKYKFGYMPETRIYNNLQDVLKNKQANSFAWVGRFVEYKHPEYLISLSLKFKAKGIKALFYVIGDGPLFFDFQKQIKANFLDEYFLLFGSIPFTEVRNVLEKCDFCLLTADEKEGWGAVLNEAMNSLCLTVSNQNTGGSSYLINSQNGVLFSGDYSSFEKATFEAIDLSYDKRRKIQINAYETIANLWNAKIAAERIYSSSFSGKEVTYNDGPMSRD